jgi:nuclear transport factor 2 (NTF2) superfamily protein
MENGRRFTLSPFTFAVAIEKGQFAENRWNSKNPEKVSLAYGFNLWK